jgi:hypothetical protein
MRIVISISTLLLASSLLSAPKLANAAGMDWTCQAILSGLPLINAVNRYVVHKMVGVAPPEVGRPESWDFDGPSMSSVPYEKSMEELFTKLGIPFDQNYFQNLVKGRSTRGLRTDALDLFGSGFFLSDVRIANSVTGLRLGPWIPRSEYPAPKLPPDFVYPTEVSGDIFRGRSWEALDRSMSERGIQKMNLVVMRPYGGWDKYRLSSGSVEASGLVYIMRRVVERLADDGEFYFTIDSSRLGKDHIFVKSFEKWLQKNTGFELLIFDTPSSVFGVIRPKS